MKDLLTPRLNKMDLHEFESVNDFFRRMKVNNGYLYNYWDNEKQDWDTNWVFVPGFDTQDDLINLVIKTPGTDLSTTTGNTPKGE